MGKAEDLRAIADLVESDEASIVSLLSENASLTAQVATLTQKLADCEAGTVPEPPPDPDPEPPPPDPPPPDPNPPPADITFSASNPYTAGKVSAAPAGTVFLFVGPMVLAKAAIPTKNNNKYLTTGSVKLDGQNSTPLAFLDSKSTGWEVDGFEITGYTCLNGAGVANKEGSAAIILRSGCILRNSHVHHNKYSGVRFEGTGAHVYDCELDNNHAEGFCGTGTNHSIERSDIHHNGDGVGTTGLGNNKGGCKIVHSTNFSYLDNHVHHNFWNGLWSDINNIGTKYLRNTIEFNQGSGIFHEVSFAAEIAHNIFRDNGINRKISPNDVYPTKAQVEVSNSPDVHIHDNEIIMSAGPLGFFGITALNSDHDQWRLGKMSSGRCLGTRNLLVENNKITVSGPEWVAVCAMTGNIPSSTSADQKCGQKPITDPASKNIWRNNTIVKTGGSFASAPYILSGAHVSESAWAAKGYN